MDLLRHLFHIAQPHHHSGHSGMHYFIFFAIVVVAIVLGTIVLHMLPCMGDLGKKISEMLCRAPGLDLVVTYFTVAPMFAGLWWNGWRGFWTGVAGQIVGMIIWQIGHEAANIQHVKGPRIVKVINAKYGFLRNYAALWVTAIVTPLFWFVRVGEVFVYPPLHWLVGLPKYNHAEWVNVSRQKYNGLVGHDLIWCLYCDWMTGVWSLGTEMLRNVESFWCPIRFDSTKKCENCKIDFPDVEGGWVDAKGTMADVTKTWEEKYPKSDMNSPWFGHPVRLTVKGKDPEKPADPTPDDHTPPSQSVD